MKHTEKQTGDTGGGVRPISGRDEVIHRGYLLAVFLLACVLYASTALQGVGWQDTGEYHYRIVTADYHWYSGIARAHPLYILMARGFVWLFPEQTSFWAANLFSGLGLACALTLLGAVVMRLTGSFRAATVAISFLCFSHMAWWLGTVAEVYTWSLAFVLAEVYCLLRYMEQRTGGWVVLLFAVNGLHLSLHNAALLGLPVYGFVLVQEVRQRQGWRAWRLVAGCLGVAGIGAGLIVGQAIERMWEGAGFGATLQSVLFGDGYSQQVLGAGEWNRKRWLANLALASVSLLNPCWWFAWRGVRSPGEQEGRRFRYGLLALTLLHGIFWVRYCVPDQATFVLPTLGLLSLWIGLGVAQTRMSRRVCVLVVMAGVCCAVMGPPALLSVARQMHVTVQRARTLPYRDEMRYWLVPWKQGEDSAARFAASVGMLVKTGDILIADSTSAGPLLAMRQAHMLSDGWRLITPWSGLSDAAIVTAIREARGAVYLVSPVIRYTPQVVLENFSFEQQGILYQLQKKDVP